MTHYSREEMERGLPPLRVPKDGQDRTAFERELDARLSTLAYDADCTPKECVAAALLLGSQGWAAFTVDVSDCTSNPGHVQFGRDLVIAAARYDESGESEGMSPKALTTKVRGMWRRAGAEWVSESSAYRYVRTHFAKSGQPNGELQALYMEDETALPIEQVKRKRRQLLKRELQRSALRLTQAFLERRD